MEKKHFSLEMRDENMLTRIFQVVLGTACFAIASYWLVFNLKNSRSGSSVWATVVFLAGFGIYLIWTGFGYGQRFIEFAEDAITLKKNSFLSPVEMKAGEIEKIEMFPLKFIVRLKSSKIILTRFGVTNIEKTELIKDEIIRFASDHNIPMEIMNEL